MNSILQEYQQQAVPEQDQQSLALETSENNISEKSGEVVVVTNEKDETQKKKKKNKKKHGKEAVDSSVGLTTQNIQSGKVEENIVPNQSSGVEPPSTATLPPPDITNILKNRMKKKAPVKTEAQKVAEAEALKAAKADKKKEKKKKDKKNYNEMSHFG